MFGPESSERIKKNSTVVKKTSQSEGSFAFKEITKNQREVKNVVFCTVQFAMRFDIESAYILFYHYSMGSLCKTLIILIFH